MQEKSGSQHKHVSIQVFTTWRKQSKRIAQLVSQ